MKSFDFKDIRKFLLRVSFCTAVLGAISACQVNKVEPLTAVTETTAFTTAARCELAVAGMYNSAQSGFYDTGAGGGGQGTVRGYPLNGVSIHFREMRGEDAINTQIFYLLAYVNTLISSSPNSTGMWNNLFALINIANVTIEGVRLAGSSGVITSSVALGYEGEARFLRAMAYHELLIHFARPYNETPDGSHLGVPIRDFAINSPSTIQRASQVGRSTVAQVYQFMLADLDFAELNLPITRAGVLNVTRATRPDAIALKQRIKLHQYDYAGAINEGNKLITAGNPAVGLIGGISLTTAADGPFTNNLSSESMFSIENNAQDNPGGNGGLPQFMAPGGRLLICISPNLWNAPWWLASDTRRSLLTSAGAGTDGRRYTTKYKDPVNGTDYCPQIRYAEVLLNQAEAIVQSTNSVNTTAITLLNAVRNRAVTNPAFQFTSASFASASELLQAIIRERRIEFAQEGDRWRQIHRYASNNAPSLIPVTFPERVLGIPAKVGPADATVASYVGAGGTSVPTGGGGGAIAIQYSDFRFVWPIPAIEIVNNPIITQNPGY